MLCSLCRHLLCKLDHFLTLDCLPGWPSSKLFDSAGKTRLKMASHRTANFEDRPYIDPNPLPSSVPHVDELGVTSAPLKSASFAIGQYCKDVNGALRLQEPLGRNRS